MLQITQYGSVLGNMVLGQNLSCRNTSGLLHVKDCKILLSLNISLSNSFFWLTWFQYLLRPHLSQNLKLLTEIFLQLHYFGPCFVTNSLVILKSKVDWVLGGNRDMDLLLWIGISRVLLSCTAMEKDFLLNTQNTLVVSFGSCFSQVKLSNHSSWKWQLYLTFLDIFVKTKKNSN